MVICSVPLVLCLHNAINISFLLPSSPTKLIPSSSHLRPCPIHLNAYCIQCSLRSRKGTYTHLLLSSFDLPLGSYLFTKSTNSYHSRLLCTLHPTYPVNFFPFGYPSSYSFHLANSPSLLDTFQGC